MALRGPRVRLWRWRRNPLRRRSDRIEAWALLVGCALAGVTGPVVGLLAEQSVANALEEQRSEWRPVVAKLTEDAPGPPSGSRAERVWAEVRWPTADGSRTGQARVAPAASEGTAVTVWNDAEGRLVAPPPSPAQAEVRAVLIGTLAGSGAAAVPLAVLRVVRGRLRRSRMEQWDEEWARIGPQWARKTW